MSTPDAALLRGALKFQLSFEARAGLGVIVVRRERRAFGTSPTRTTYGHLVGAAKGEKGE